MMTMMIIIIIIIIIHDEMMGRETLFNDTVH